MSTERNERAVRAAQNESVFRDINERIETLNEKFNHIAPTTEWICECADLTCTERITMTPEEYTGIRESGRHFAIAPGHVVADLERVSARLDNYWVVEKLGQAGETADELDPRSNDDPE